MKSPHWAIVVALPHEAKGFLARLSEPTITHYRGGKIYESSYRGQPCLLIQTGLGPQNAERMLGFVLENFSFTHLIATGYCGALVPGFKTGEIVLAHTLLSEKASAPAIDLNCDFLESVSKILHDQQAPLHLGKLITVSEAVLIPEKKHQLAQNSQAIAVDMESYPIFNLVKAKAGIAALALRFILDKVEDQLIETKDFLEEQGQVKPLQLLQEVFRRPKILTQLPFLERLASQARKSMLEFTFNIMDHYSIATDRGG